MQKVCNIYIAWPQLVSPFSSALLNMEGRFGWLNTFHAELSPKRDGGDRDPRTEEVETIPNATLLPPLRMTPASSLA